MTKNYHFYALLLVFTLYLSGFSLVRLGEFPIGEAVNDIEVYKNYVLTTHNDSGLQVIDISTCLIPVRIGSYDSPQLSEYFSGIAVSGSNSFTASKLGTVQMLSLLSPEAPSLVNEVALSDSAHHIAIEDSIAVVALGSKGMQILSFALPSQPKVIGSYFAKPDSTHYNSTIEVALRKQHAFIAFRDSGIHIVDISDPANPQFVSHFRFNQSVPIYAIAVTDSFMYVAAQEWTLSIINIADPKAPAFYGFYSMPGGVKDTAVDVALFGKYAAVLFPTQGIHVVDVSTPSQPLFKDSYPEGSSVGNNFQKMALSEQYAFLYNHGKEQVEIIDLAPIISIKTLTHNTLNNSPMRVLNSVVTHHTPVLMEFDVTSKPLQDAQLSVSLYSVQGTLLHTLFTGSTKTIATQLSWSGEGGEGQRLPAGFYYISLVIDGRITATYRTMILR